MKKAILIVLLLAIVLGVGGCMNIFEKSIYDQMVSNMEKKYGEKFTFIESEGANIVQGSSDRGAYVSSEKFPDEEILIRAKVGEDGKYHFTDNYVEFLLKDEVTEWMKNVITPIYGECKVYFERYKDATMPENFGKDTKLEEYLHSISVGICIIAGPGVDIGKKDEDIEKLRLKLKENKVCSEITICYLTGNDYDTITERNFRDYINNRDVENRIGLKAFGSFYMNSSFEFYIKDWM